MIRIAILSDIHGNLTALEMVLEQLAREQVDRFLVLGDVALFGPHPREVIARLRELKPDIMIMGNTDHWLIHSGGVDNNVMDTEEDRQKFARMTWCYQQLTSEDRDFLGSFLSTAEIELEGGLSLLAYHGSPRSFVENIWPDTPDADLEMMFNGTRARVMVGGHTHRPMLRRFQDKTIFNPGTVGLTAARTPGGFFRPAWAEYAVLESGADGLHISLRRANLNLDHYSRAVLNSGMPYAEEFLADWK